MHCPFAVLIAARSQQSGIPRRERIRIEVGSRSLPRWTPNRSKRLIVRQFAFISLHGPPVALANGTCTYILAGPISLISRPAVDTQPVPRAFFESFPRRFAAYLNMASRSLWHFCAAVGSLEGAGRSPQPIRHGRFTSRHAHINVESTSRCDRRA